MRDGHGMGKDAYVASALIYDLLNASFRPGQVVAPERLIPLARAESGSVLDIGTGSDPNTVLVPERLPKARIYVLEPNTVMRVLILMKVVVHPEWFDRVTVRPEAFDVAPLPDVISVMIPLGVLGRFNPDERAALFAVPAAQLPGGGAALTDLQPPCRLTRVGPYEIASARVGDLTYNDFAERRPFDDEHMQWKMTYRTPDGGRVLAEEATEYLFRHPDPEVIRTELRATGLSLDRIEDTAFYLIVKD